MSISEQVSDKVRDQVLNRVYRQVSDQVWDQVLNRVFDQMEEDLDVN